MGKAAEPEPEPERRPKATTDAGASNSTIMSNKEEPEPAADSGCVADLLPYSSPDDENANAMSSIDVPAMQWLLAAA